MSTRITGTVGTAPRTGSLLRPAAIGATAATIANSAIFIAGSAAGATFLVNSPLGVQIRVDLVAIVPTTLLMFAIGTGVLGWAVRRSRRWFRVVVGTAALFALATASAPPAVAQDSVTGALLASMHLVTGAAFLATAWFVRQLSIRNQARSSVG